MDSKGIVAGCGAVAASYDCRFVASLRALGPFPFGSHRQPRKNKIRYRVKAA